MGEGKHRKFKKNRDGEEEDGKNLKGWKHLRFRRFTSKSSLRNNFAGSTELC